VSLPSAAHVFPPALTPSLSVLSLWNTSLDNILQHLSLVLIPALDSLRIFPSSLPLASSRLMDPPFVGIVETTLNALILFESSRRDHLPSDHEATGREGARDDQERSRFRGSSSFFPPLRAQLEAAAFVADLRQGRVRHQEMDGWTGLVTFEE
jgi:hypothetical protein